VAAYAGLAPTPWKMARRIRATAPTAPRNLSRDCGPPGSCGAKTAAAFSGMVIKTAWLPVSTEPFPNFGDSSDPAKDEPLPRRYLGSPAPRENIGKCPVNRAKYLARQEWFL
jgi:hypothetical protein